ncbi:N-acetylmuramoyl-L-alanine amidase [Microvirga flavescens]|uniref:N-acetylmuramoyl-L-alanine amidase n=1 Tax=Microvirga flavescens TaxID=2249811 RepID=UPI000DD69F6E|nr:N-acetylmuramoyl-L-alanine amidase [Microvirga flavescens]
MHDLSFSRLACFFLLVALFAGGAGPVAAAPNNGKPAPIAAEADRSPAVAADIILESEASKTRFKVVLSKPVTVSAFVMERPDRVIVDLPEVAFHVPAEAGRRKAGAVASFRYGLFAPGQSRVVIDLAQTAVVSATEVSQRDDGSHLLTIELTRVEREEYRRAAAANAAATAAKASISEPELASNQDARPLIVIDPGHGGIDPGAASLIGTYEKDLVLAFAQLLKKRLDDGGRYRVVLTRDNDVFISLSDRVKFAQKRKADLFISIHADSLSGGQDVRGLTVYTRAERASDADSARLADRENKADAIAGVDAKEESNDVSDILQELTLRETRVFSHGFATNLVSSLESVARLNKNSRREAGFWVLRAHDVPSVLLELGYLSSKQDYDLLISDEWRAKATASIAAAVDRFFTTRFAKRDPAAVLP